MRFVVRIDDIGWKPEHKIDQGLELAQQLHIRMNGAPYVAAIIPTALDPAGLQWLKSKPAGLTVAVHGLDHSEVEFRNLDQAQMHARIAEAKQQLCEVDCRDLVLPFNQYESGLSSVCTDLGIDRIWGGGNHIKTDPSIGDTPPTPYPLEKCIFIPSWKPTYAATLWRIRDDILGLNNTLPWLSLFPGKAVIVLHITWEASYSSTLAGIRWLAESIGDKIISAEEYLR